MENSAHKQSDSPNNIMDIYYIKGNTIFSNKASEVSENPPKSKNFYWK